MPGADQILEGLTRIAREWTWLAMLWHAVVAVMLAAIVTGRAQRRSIALTMSAMVASVAAMAWWSGNWFNAAVFGTLAIEMARQALRLSVVDRCSPSRSWPIGAAALGFGWVYPHFLDDASRWEYAYAAPMGLIPCPTLAAVIGLSLIVGLFESRRWGILLGSTGLVYGVIGVARLGVWIDAWLIAAAVAAIVAALRRERNIPRRWVISREPARPST
jgi:hypothetical protein